MKDESKDRDKSGIHVPGYLLPVKNKGAHYPHKTKHLPEIF